MCGPGGYRYNIFCGVVITSYSGPNTTTPAVDDDACSAVCDNDPTCAAWSFSYDANICDTYATAGVEYTTKQDEQGVYALYEEGGCPLSP